jgi:16S rRNA (adenine1518-N6/adenine1519-N6)-dimethyltransferase
VGTRIVIDVIERAPAVSRLVVMLQREVAERLAAVPGSPTEDAYGAVSVRVDYRATAEIVRRVPPEVFWPRPTVGSAIVRIERRPAPLVEIDEERLWQVVETAFAERRKTIRNGVRRLGLTAAQADDVLARADVEPARRPEELGVREFARIVEALPA